MKPPVGVKIPLSVIPVYVPGSGLEATAGPPATRQLTCVELATFAVAFATVVAPDCSEIVTVDATEAAPLYASVITWGGPLHEAGETVTFGSLDVSERAGP